MATKAEKTTEIQNSGQWLDLEGPTLIKDDGKYKTYGFKGVRTVNAAVGSAAELVVKRLMVIDEGTGTEQAEWLSEDPTVKPPQYQVYQAIENRIANGGNPMIGIVEGTLRINAFLKTATFTAIEESGADSVEVRYSLTVDRATETPTFRKIV